jgi:hypothetical protein
MNKKGIGKGILSLVETTDALAGTTPCLVIGHHLINEWISNSTTTGNHEKR